MATITKYVTENVSVLDKNYVPIIFRVYKKEQVSINENIYKVIEKAYKGYYSKSLVCLNKEIKKCEFNSVKIADFVVLKEKENVSLITTKPADLVFYNKKEVKNIILQKDYYEEFKNLIWLEFNNNDTLWSRKTFFEYYNPVIMSTFTLDLCLVNSYDRELTVIETNSLFDIKFGGFELPQTILPNSSFCFKIKFELSSPYLEVDNKRIALKVDDGKKQFYLKWHICLKRVPIANAYILYPDKNSYTETYYFNTFSFRSINGVEVHYPTMDNPKLNFSAKYSHLELYKHKFGENVVLENERQAISFPLWSEFTKTTETKEKTTVLKIEKIPKAIKVGSRLFLIEDETKALNVTVVRIVDDTTIQILEQVSYKAGQIVVPAIQTFIKNNTSVNRELNDNSFSVTLSSTEVVKDLK